MSTIELDQLGLNIEWASVLDAILAKARAACLQNDHNMRVECQEQLIEFIESTPARLIDLDVIAANVNSYLFMDQITESVAAIDRNQLELRSAVNTLDKVTKEARKNERSLHYCNTVDILKQASKSIDVLLNLERQMTDPDLDLIVRIDAISKSIQALFDRTVEHEKV